MFSLGYMPSKVYRIAVKFTRFNLFAMWFSIFAISLIALLSCSQVVNNVQCVMCNCAI
jgi:hypothetical protein